MSKDTQPSAGALRAAERILTRIRKTLHPSHSEAVDLAHVIDRETGHDSAELIEAIAKHGAALDRIAELEAANAEMAAALRRIANHGGTRNHRMDFGDCRDIARAALKAAGEGE